MAFLTPTDYQTRDLFLYYDYEDAFLRYDHVTQQFFLKLTNGQPEYERRHHNRLVCEVTRHGVEVSKEEYLAAKITSST